MKIIITALTAILITFTAGAAEVPAWKINPAQSKIEFKVMQDASTITGSFKKFDGKINFDKAQLAKSKVAIDIDITSITLSFADAIATAQSQEWLATKTFPKATFVAEKFSAAKQGFRADGNLTIKGKTVPVVLEFSFDDYSTNKAKAIGKAMIKRSAFGVGNSDVKKANGVKDEIEVSFVLTAEK